MMRKAFGRKKNNTIGEANLNKRSNIRNANVIRINEDQAIQADPAIIKRIQTFIEKKTGLKKGDLSDEDAAKQTKNIIESSGVSLNEIVEHLGDVQYTIVEIEKSNIDMSLVKIVGTDFLQLTEDVGIKGPPELIKAAYDYVQRNKTSVLNPDSIIKAVDKPVVVTFAPVQEEKTGNIPTREEIDERYRDEEEKGDTAVLSQLSVVYKTDLDKMVDARDTAIENISLRAKYRSLGLLLEIQSFKEKAAKGQEEIAKTGVDLSFPESISTEVFENFLVRRPPLDLKISAFNDTYKFSDLEGETRTRASAYTIQADARRLKEKFTSLSQLEDDNPIAFREKFDALPLSEQEGYNRFKKSEITIETNIIDISKTIDRPMRNFFIAEMIDTFNPVFNTAPVVTEEKKETHGLYPGKLVTLVDGRSVVIVGVLDQYVDILVGESTIRINKDRIVDDEEIIVEAPSDGDAPLIELPDTIGLDYITRDQYFRNRIATLRANGQIVSSDDIYGKQAYSDFIEGVNAFKSASKSSDDEEEMPNPKERDNILFRLANIIAWNFKRLYPTAYAILPFYNFKGFYESMETGPTIRRSILGPDVNVSSIFEANFMRHVYRNFDRMIAETDFQQLEKEYLEGAINPLRLDNVIYIEIANYLRNHMDDEYQDFFIFPQIPLPTEEQIQMIGDEWAAIQNKYNIHAESHYIAIEDTPGLENVVDVKNQVLSLENKLFMKNKRIEDYVLTLAQILFYVQSPYAKSFRERLILGDLKISDLLDVDPVIAFPEFSLSPSFDEDLFQKYVDSNKAIIGNSLLNSWLYTKSFKRKEEVWFRVEKVDWNPNVVNVVEMCGDKTVFVRINGKVVCKSRDEVLQNIEGLAKNNGDEFKRVLVPEEVIPIQLDN